MVGLIIISFGKDEIKYLNIVVSIFAAKEFQPFNHGTIVMMKM